MSKLHTMFERCEWNRVDCLIMWVAYLLQSGEWLLAAITGYWPNYSWNPQYLEEWVINRVRERMGDDDE